MMFCMRTTLTLDPDVAKKLKELGHLKQMSFKETVNSVLRRGLNAGSEIKGDPKFVVAAHRGGFRPGIDPLKLNQLIDQLETDDFVAETRSKRR